MRQPTRRSIGVTTPRSRAPAHSPLQIITYKAAKKKKNGHCPFTAARREELVRNG